jgi:hypothetical protein
MDAAGKNLIYITGTTSNLYLPYYEITRKQYSASGLS